MTFVTTTTFDIDALKRNWEAWDIDALLALYSEDIQLIEIEHDHPPSSPRVRRGKDVLRGMFEGGAAAGVRVTLGNLVPGPQRAAATITCELPGGDHKIVSNSILEIEDGRIVVQRDVQVRE